MEVSIIMVAHNAESQIEQCMRAISDQTVLDGDIEMEIVVFNNASTDNTDVLLKSWKEYFLMRDVNFIILGSPDVIQEGSAKNKAIKKSSGQYLCFQRCADVMLPDRIELQLSCAHSNQNAIIGSQTLRNPDQPPCKLETWANELEQISIKEQIYTSNGPTLLVSTWFFSKSIYDKVGGFTESEYYAFEYTLSDMMFYYAHLDNGGSLIRLKEKLLIFTYCDSFKMTPVTEEKLWQFRVSRIEQYVLPHWECFIIWNTRMARRFIRNLTENGRKRVKAFCDLDDDKIGKKIDLYCPKKKASVIRLTTVHFFNAKSLVIICNINQSDGDLHKFIKCKKFVEGIDFIVFD